VTHLQAIPDGFGPSEEHIRVLEAYRREHDIPVSLPYSTAAFNRAVDWWNAGAPPTSQDPERRAGDAIVAHLAEQPEFAGDRSRPEPRDLWMRREGDRYTFMQPVPPRIFASLDLLNSELVDGVSFCDGVLRIVDSEGFELKYRPLWIDVLVVALERVVSRDDVFTTPDAPTKD
jgi:hypothetical protein